MGAFLEHLLGASPRQESPRSLGGLSVHLKTSHCGCQGQGPGCGRGTSKRGERQWSLRPPSTLGSFERPALQMGKQRPAGSAASSGAA